MVGDKLARASWWILTGMVGATLAPRVLTGAGAAGLRDASPQDEPSSAAQTQPATVPTTQPGGGPGERNPLAAPAPPADDRNRAAREQLISGLIGSKHDFTHGGRSGRDLCLPCHTPHLVATPPPLLDKRPDVTAPLRAYQAHDFELNGWSLLCLGCHDGVTAKDVFSSGHAISVSDQFANTQLGTRGLRSHPLGIRYPPPSDPEYHPAAAVEATGMRLPDGRIQCTTCHDAHNTHRIKGMLRTSNDRSGMCLACHRL